MIKIILASSVIAASVFAFSGNADKAHGHDRSAFRKLEAVTMNKATCNALRTNADFAAHARSIKGATVGSIVTWCAFVGAKL